jgi:hypothetical protein
MENFPSYSNTAGTVALATISQQVTDIFAYSESMHFSLLNSFDGVSLERIFPDEASQSPFNWHSASEPAGWGTPGYRNSQYLNSGAPAPDELFTLDTDIFSPDNDGYQDVLTMRYIPGEPGALATIRIYDAEGRLVRTLLNNVLLGTEGYLTWDGLNDNGEKATTGIHIVFMELLTGNGFLKTARKPCVLASRL